MGTGLERSGDSWVWGPRDLRDLAGSDAIVCYPSWRQSRTISDFVDNSEISSNKLQSPA